MGPEDQNMGSFGAGVLGDTSALRAAMEKRGISTGILNQVSPAAPTGPSPVSPGVPEGAANMGASIDQTLQPTTPQADNQPQFRSGEAEIALKALRDVAKTEAKIAEQTLALGTLQ